jgi:SAM-dependent methyltransferase
MRVNVGCGRTPTAGWLNLDASPSVALSRLPTVVIRAAAALGLLTREQAEFTAFCRTHDIRRADAARLPLTNGATDVVYSCHMLEHLDREDARAFLREAFRVLRPSGTIRIAIPDLARMVQEYVVAGDADTLVADTMLAATRPRSWRARFRATMSGDIHRWMYDGRSLTKALEAAGFVNASVVTPGLTRIPHPGALNLHERAEQSIYVEATRP